MSSSLSLQSGRQILLPVQCPDDTPDAAVSTTLAQVIIQLFADESDDGRWTDAVCRQQQVVVLLSAWSDVVSAVQYSHVGH